MRTDLTRPLLGALAIGVAVMSAPSRSNAMDATDCAQGSAYLGDAAQRLASAEELVVHGTDRAKAAFKEGSSEYDFAVAHWGDCFRGREELEAVTVGFQERYLRISFTDTPDAVVADAEYMRFTRERLRAEHADSRFPEYWSRIERYDAAVQSAANLVRATRARYEEHR